MEVKMNFSFFQISATFSFFGNIDLLYVKNGQKFKIKNRMKKAENRKIYTHLQHGTD